MRLLDGVCVCTVYLLEKSGNKQPFESLCTSQATSAFVILSLARHALSISFCLSSFRSLYSSSSFFVVLLPGDISCHQPVYIHQLQKDNCCYSGRMERPRPEMLDCEQTKWSTQHTAQHPTTTNLVLLHPDLERTHVLTVASVPPKTTTG